MKIIKNIIYILIAVVVVIIPVKNYFNFNINLDSIFSFDIFAPGDKAGGDKAGGDITGGDKAGGDITGGDKAGGDIIKDNVAGGDIVGGDKTVIINNYHYNEIVINAVDSNKEILNKEFSNRYLPFGIKEEKIEGSNNKIYNLITPEGYIPEDVKVIWDTGRILKLTNEKIRFVLPTFIIGRSESTFQGNIANIKNEVGRIQSLGYKLGNLIPYAVVLGKDKASNIIVIGIGFKEAN